MSRISSCRPPVGQGWDWVGIGILHGSGAISQARVLRAGTATSSERPPAFQERGPPASALPNARMRRPPKGRMVPFCRSLARGNDKGWSRGGVFPWRSPSLGGTFLRVAQHSDWRVRELSGTAATRWSPPTTPCVHAQARAHKHRKSVFYLPHRKTRRTRRDFDHRRLEAARMETPPPESGRSGRAQTYPSSPGTVPENMPACCRHVGCHGMLFAGRRETAVQDFQRNLPVAAVLLPHLHVWTAVLDAASLALEAEGVRAIVTGPISRRSAHMRASMAGRV